MNEERQSSERSKVLELIEAAVQTLNAFNQRNKSIKDPLKKTMDLMVGIFSEKKRLKYKKESLAVGDAIRILQSNSMLLNFLHDSPLAAAAKDAIDIYNSIVDEERSRPKSLSSNIVHYLAEQNGVMPVWEMKKINLSKPLASIKIDYTDQEIKSAVVPPCLNSQANVVTSYKIADLARTMAPAAGPLFANTYPDKFKTAVALFRLKVIIQVEKLIRLSHQEAREVVNKTPIHIETEGKEKCHLSCTLKPFPGHTIKVSCDFGRDVQSEIFTILQQDSFKLSAISNQSGFPHPCQYNASAFPDFVPPYPYLDDMLQFKPLFQRKQKIAHELLPNEPLHNVAKRNYSKKKEAFGKYQPTFLALHRAYTIAILEATWKPAVPELFSNAASRYYDRLNGMFNAFDYLSETNQIIIENFFQIPYEKLQNAWIEKAFPETLPADMDKGFHYASDFLALEMAKTVKHFETQGNSAQTELEKITIDFILSMGKTFMKPWSAIILQQFSEVIPYKPPMLDDLEQLEQTASFRQLITFLDELELGLSDDIEAVAANMEAHLKADTSLLKIKSFETIEESEPAAAYTVEIGHYYNARFYANRAGIN